MARHESGGATVTSAARATERPHAAVILDAAAVDVHRLDAEERDAGVAADVRRLRTAARAACIRAGVRGRIRIGVTGAGDKDERERGELHTRIIKPA